MELVAGGREKLVTLADHVEFCSAVEKYRLEEGSTAIAAIKRGLETIIPLPLISIFTWQELEVMLCGRPEIDIALLKLHTVSSLNLQMKFFSVGCYTGRTQSRLWMSVRFLESLTTPDNSTTPMNFPAYMVHMAALALIMSS